MRALAPHEVGGRAADRACRSRRRLAGDARHRGAHRSWPTPRSAPRCAICCAEAAAARTVSLAKSGAAGRGQRAISCSRMGKMGARELNYSSDIDLIVFYDAGVAALAPGTELAPFFVRLTRELVKLLQERTGRRLRVPHRSAAAARSGLDPDRGLDRRRARLLRERRPELGARRDDQGARPAPATSRPARSCCASSRRSSGASISTSPRSPTSTP